MFVFVAMGGDVVAETRRITDRELSARADKQATPRGRNERPASVEWTPWMAAAMPPAALLAMAEGEMERLDPRAATWTDVGLRDADRAQRQRIRVALDLLVAGMQREMHADREPIPVAPFAATLADSLYTWLPDAVTSALAAGVAHGVLDSNTASEAVARVLGERCLPRVTGLSTVRPGDVAVLTLARRDDTAHGWMALDEILLDGAPTPILALNDRKDRVLLAIRAPETIGVHQVFVRWRGGVALPNPDPSRDVPLPPGVDASPRSLAVVTGTTPLALHVSPDTELFEREIDPQREPLRDGFGRARLSLLGGGDRTAILVSLTSRSTLAWDGDLEIERNGSWIRLVTLTPFDGTSPMREVIVPMAAHEFGDVVRLRYRPRDGRSRPISLDGSEGSVVLPWKLATRSASRVWARPTIYTLTNFRAEASYFAGDVDCGRVVDGDPSVDQGIR